jgi:hypothetical protein
MSKHYFLSRVIGSGTELDPFRPAAAKFGRFGMLDLRPDATSQQGWCFACVECEDEVVSELGTHLIDLGNDAKIELDDAVINSIKHSLGVNFKSQTLSDIIAEILLFGRMSGRGLKQGVDGTYRIRLGGVLWEATEAEAYEFVGKIREDELLGPPPRAHHRSSVELRSALAADLISIAQVVGYDNPTWLKDEIAKVKAGRSKHPLARNYSEANELLEDSDPTLIYSSSAAIWLKTLAHDLRVTNSQIDVRRFASRLRATNDCEPTKYELFVMAGYLSAGVRVELTDSDSTGEFRAFCGDQCVHIECKHKNLSAIAPRKVRAVFEKGAGDFRNLMELKDARYLVLISCRTDPSLEELPELMESISRGLENEIGEAGLQIKHGKFEVKLLPGTVATANSGVQLPAGFDFGFSEATPVKKGTDKISMENGWGVLWRVQRPGGWIRSVVDSLRQAAAQVPSDTPNIVYLHIPGRGLGEMITRIDSVQPEIEDLLSTPERYRRINAVVLTGEAEIYGWSGPNIATVRYAYLTVENRNARNPLPAKFRVFGRDFTRK